MDKLITLQNLKQRVAAELDRRPAEERDAAMAKVGIRTLRKACFKQLSEIAENENLFDMPLHLPVPLSHA